MRKEIVKNKWRSSLPIIWAIFLSFWLFNAKIQAATDDQNESVSVKEIKIKNLDRPLDDEIFDGDRILITLDVDSKDGQRDLDDQIDLTFDKQKDDNFYLEPIETNGKVFFNFKEIGEFHFSKNGYRLSFKKGEANFRRAEISIACLARNNQSNQGKVTIQAGNCQKTIFIKARKNQAQVLNRIKKFGSVQGEKIYWQTIIPTACLRQENTRFLREEVDNKQSIIPETIKFWVSGKSYSLDEFTEAFKTEARVNSTSIIEYELNKNILPSQEVKISYQTRIKNGYFSDDFTSTSKTLAGEKSKEYPVRAIWPFKVIQEKELENGQLVIVNRIFTAQRQSRPLSGTKFVIEALSASFPTDFKEINTDQRGVAILNHLKAGIYLVKQVRVPDGVLLNDKPTVVEIKENQTPQVITFLNQVKTKQEELSLDKAKVATLPQIEMGKDLKNLENRRVGDQDKNQTALPVSGKHNLNMRNAIDSFKQIRQAGKPARTTYHLPKATNLRNDSYQRTSSYHRHKSLPQAGVKSELWIPLIGCILLGEFFLVAWILKRGK